MILSLWYFHIWKRLRVIGIKIERTCINYLRSLFWFISWWACPFIINVFLRLTFSWEFKLNAVELSCRRSNIKELDVRSELIYLWCSEFASNKGTSFLGNGNPKLTQGESEISRLRKELLEMRMERGYIKKKAVSIFSKGDRRYVSISLNFLLKWCVKFFK